MIKQYVKEADAIDMEVQVGPKEEENVQVKPEEAVPSAVDLAKKDPNTIVIADVKKDDEVAGEIHEYYVDAADVAKYADLTEKTMLEALNDIIECHEDCDISADNIVLIMSEGTEGYVRNLERNGAACVFFNESSVEDIDMEVQVGPNGEEVSVKADPQEANPVDAVKRNYDTVVVAKDGDNFFMDVEDVQKCADLKCESVIETLNGIIAANEDFDMNTENIRILVNESATDETLDALEEAGVLCVLTEVKAEGKKEKKAVMNKTVKALKSYFKLNGARGVSLSTFSIGGKNKEFCKGDGKTILIGLSSARGNASVLGGGGYSRNDDKDIDDAIKLVKSEKKEIIKAIEKETGESVKELSISEGRLGVTNIEITFK